MAEDLGPGLEERQPTFVQELDEAMVLVREDVCEWLTGLFDLSEDNSINAGNFLDRLDDGVVLCRLCEVRFIDVFSKMFR